MTTVKQLEKEIRRIKDRNRKVAADKQWERSRARRMMLTVLTYLLVGLYLQVLGVSQAWLNALVPATAFMLSTLSLPFFRAVWLNGQKRKT